MRVSKIKENNYSEAYVGRTSNVNRRINQIRRSIGKFKDVYIVYATKNLEHAKSMEGEMRSLSILNQSDGSDGSKGQPPYYVYVAFRR
ncbi:MAG: hypothetical protein ABIL38_00710 [candidate division WOR-3 bacterium]